MSDLAFAGAAAQAELIRTKKVSSRELTELYLERIARHDPTLNAYRIVFAERALTEAAQADARRKAKDHRPLLGVPVAVKDDQDIAGEITTKGSIAQDKPAAQDSEIVQRLREDGAVILGKTNVPELMTMDFTETLWFGVTRNPWDTDRTPGGSSGGSAAAVAAGLCAAATASDGAGSIRIPAAATGLVGLKPAPGVVPTPESWNGLSTFGYLSRTVADAALLNRIVPLAPEPLRISYSVKPPLFTIRPPTDVVQKAFDAMREVLSGLGHQVTEKDPDWGMIGPRVVVRYLRGVHDDAVSLPHPKRLDRRSRGLSRLGRALPDSVFNAARAAAEEDRRRIVDGMDDILMLPVFTQLPAKIGQSEGMGAVRSLDAAFKRVPYAGGFNHTGLPAIAVPAPSNGFPLAVQFVGPPGSEARLLGLAAQLEDTLGWPARIPPGFE
jgi:amidase